MAHTFSDRPLGGMAAPPAGPDRCAHPGCPAFRPQAPPQAPRWLPGCPGGRSLAGLGSHGVARWCPANPLVLRGGGFLRRRGSLWTSRSRGTAVAGGVLQLSALCPPRHTCPEAAQASLAAGLQDQADQVRGLVPARPGGLWGRPPPSCRSARPSRAAVVGCGLPFVSGRVTLCAGE